MNDIYYPIKNEATVVYSPVRYFGECRPCDLIIAAGSRSYRLGGKSES